MKFLVKSNLSLSIVGSLLVLGQIFSQSVNAQPQKGFDLAYEHLDKLSVQKTTFSKNIMLAQSGSGRFTTNPRQGVSGTYVNLVASNIVPGTTVIFSEQGVNGTVVASANNNGVAYGTFVAYGHKGQSIVYEALVAPGASSERYLSTVFRITD